MSLFVLFFGRRGRAIRLDHARADDFSTVISLSGDIESSLLCLALAPRTKQCLEGLLTVDQAFVCVQNSAC